MISKRLFPFAILLAVASGSTLAPVGAQAPRKLRVAVMDFDYAPVHTAASTLLGTSIDLGKGISGLLTTNLAKDGTFSVVDRETLQEVMANQDYADADRSDPAIAAKLGRTLHADAVIIGAVTQFGGGQQNGDAAAEPAGSPIQVRLAVRIVNVETGQIQGVAEGAGDSSGSPASDLGGKGWHGWASDNLDFASNDFQQTKIGQAIKAAVDQLSGNLVADSSKAMRTSAKMEGVVASVDGNQIVVNEGSGAGVRSGDLLEVVRTTREIKDPATGETIRRLTSTVGVIQATDVDEKSSVCQVLSGSGFQIGDRVRPAPPTPPASAPAAAHASAPPAPAAPPPATPPPPAPAAPTAPAAAAPQASTAPPSPAPAPPPAAQPPAASTPPAAAPAPPASAPAAPAPAPAPAAPANKPGP